MSIGYYYHTFVIGQRLLTFVPGQAGNFGIGQIQIESLRHPHQWFAVRLSRALDGDVLCYGNGCTSQWRR